jgi:hypothetical protein
MSLLLEQVEHQAPVVEALGAEQGDGEDDRIDAVRPGRPASGLHGPDALDLARRADHGDPGLGRQAVAGQVEFGQRHGLVVVAAGRVDELLGRGGQVRHALPGLFGVVARTGDHRTVYVAGGQGRDQDGRDHSTVLGVVGPGPGPHRVGVGDRTEAVAGGSTGDLPVGVGRVDALDRRGRHLVVGRPGQDGGRRPQGLVAEPTTGTEIPTE